MCVSVRERRREKEGGESIITRPAVTRLVVIQARFWTHTRTLTHTFFLYTDTLGAIYRRQSNYWECVGTLGEDQSTWRNPRQTPTLGSHLEHFVLGQVISVQDTNLNFWSYLNDMHVSFGRVCNGFWYFCAESCKSLRIQTHKCMWNSLKC